MRGGLDSFFPGTVNNNNNNNNNNNHNNLGNPFGNLGNLGSLSGPIINNNSSSSSSSSMDNSTFSYTDKIIVIDSRDRDVGLFPNPATYELDLLEDIQDVISLELLAADVPMVSYHITESNRAIPVEIEATGSTSTGSGNSSSQAATQVVMAQMDLGDYTGADDVAQQAAAALNAVASQFTVTYLPRTDNFCITRRGGQFSLRFDQTKGQRNAARVLGFSSWQPYASAPNGLGEHEIRAPWRRDMTSDRYAILFMEPAYVNYNPLNSAIDKSFAIVPPSSSNDNISIDGGRRKDFKPPVARFSKVRINFIDRMGKPYEFHGRDHRLELRFTSIRQKKYTQQTQRIMTPFEGIISER